MSEKQLVKSVIKALSIIELLNEQGELGVTEVGARLGMDKSTTFRLLTTLKEKHYVNADPRTQKYANSGKFITLGQGVLRQYNVNPILRLELKRLSEQTGETVNFAVPDGMEVLYLDSHETADIIKLAARIGQRRPMYCTSCGKAILAFYKPEYAQALCKNFVYTRHTEYTLTSREALSAELERIRRQGYSVDNQEHSLDIHCVGIPLLNHGNEPLGAVSISMPQFRLEKDPGKHDLCVNALLEASDRLRRALLS